MANRPTPGQVQAAEVVDDCLTHAHAEQRVSAVAAAATEAEVRRAPAAVGGWAAIAHQTAGRAHAAVSSKASNSWRRLASTSPTAERSSSLTIERKLRSVRASWRQRSATAASRASKANGSPASATPLAESRRRQSTAALICLYVRSAASL